MLIQDIDIRDFWVLPIIHWDKDIELLYNVNYYDGPLEGLLSHAGKPYWFVNVFEDWTPNATDFDHPRRTRWFILFVLTQKQLETHNYWHNKFEHHLKNGTLDEFYPPYQTIKFEALGHNQAKYLMIDD